MKYILWKLMDKPDRPGAFLVQCYTNGQHNGMGHLFRLTRFVQLFSAIDCDTMLPLRELGRIEVRIEP